MRGFRQGKMLAKADVARRVEAYHKKVEEYSAKTLDELKALDPTLKGVYKKACEYSMLIKQREIMMGEMSKDVIDIGKTEEELDENREMESKI